jgi:beta-lactamase superfamily II metal-dependent hydrolase
MSKRTIPASDGGSATKRRKEEDYDHSDDKIVRVSKKNPSTEPTPEVFRRAMARREVRTPFILEILGDCFGYHADEVPDDGENWVIAAIGQHFPPLQSDYKTAPNVIRTRRAGDATNPVKLASGYLQAYLLAKEAAESLEHEAEINKQKQQQDEVVSGGLSLIFFDVGQGDCTLIKTPQDHLIMIDCGSAGGRVTPSRYIEAIADQLSALRPSGPLDILILTHPDKDHHNLSSRVFRRWLPGRSHNHVVRAFHSNFSDKYHNSVSVGNATSSWLADALKKTSQTSRTLLNRVIVRENLATIDGKRVGPEAPGKLEWKNEDGSITVLQEKDGATVKLLASEVGLDTSAHGINSASIVVLIEAFGKRILVCGDATDTTDKFLIDRYGDKIKNVDILRCSHHGANERCNGENFAAHVNAKEVIVSASRDSFALFGHPNLKVLKRYWRHALNEADDRSHNVFYWFKQAKQNVKDNLNSKDGKLSSDLRIGYRKKRLFTTGGNGTQIRRFDKPAGGKA